MHEGKSTEAPCSHKYGKYKNSSYIKTAFEEWKLVYNLIQEVKNNLKILEK